MVWVAVEYTPTFRLIDVQNLKLYIGTDSWHQFTEAFAIHTFLNNSSKGSWAISILWSIWFFYDSTLKFVYFLIPINFLCLVFIIYTLSNKDWLIFGFIWLSHEEHIYIVYFIQLFIAILQLNEYKINQPCNLFGSDFRLKLYNCTMNVVSVETNATLKKSLFLLNKKSLIKFHCIS